MSEDAGTKPRNVAMLHGRSDAITNSVTVDFIQKKCTKLILERCVLLASMKKRLLTVL